MDMTCWPITYIVACSVGGAFAHYQLIIPMNIPARSVRSASGEVT